MRKSTKISVIAASLACMMAFPSFAATTKTEFQESSAKIREELKAIEEQMKPLREENKAVSEACKAIRMEKKEAGTLPIDSADWEAVVKLCKEMQETRKTFDHDEIKNLRARAKSAKESGDYDLALSYLEDALEAKKDRLKNLETINDYWDQINELIQ